MLLARFHRKTPEQSATRLGSDITRGGSEDGLRKLAGSHRLDGRDLLAPQRQAQRAEVGTLGQRNLRLDRRIREHNLIEADVAPTARLLIDDLQLPLAACPRPHIEAARRHAIVVVPRRRRYDLTVHQQIDARAAFVITAADEEADVVAFDREGPAGQHPDVCIASRHVLALANIVRVDDPLASPSDIPLVRSHARHLDRARAERRAFDRPAFVRLFLKILERQIGPGLGTTGPAARRPRNAPGT